MQLSSGALDCLEKTRRAGLSPGPAAYTSVDACLQRTYKEFFMSQIPELPLARALVRQKNRAYQCKSRLTSTLKTAISFPTCGWRQRFCAPARLETLFLLGEAAAHQRIECIDHLARLPSRRFDLDRAPGTGGQHHQAHDGGAADGFLTSRHLYFGLEFFDGLHEFRRSARVQAFLVANLKYARHDSSVRAARTAVRSGRGLAHFSVSTRLAIVMYLRPESCAAATASGSGHSSLTFASLTSMGRLMPARTSTFGRPITDMARLEGVPPNMSVKMATPWPLSTRLTASMMSLRRCSTSSSGPMVTASIWVCGPTTCSRADRNSTARRPCVTRTSPIIESPESRLHRTKGRPSWPSPLRAQGAPWRFRGNVALWLRTRGP